MSTVFPALRGKIGDTVYYSIVVPASWASNNLTIPSEMEGWEDETVQERYQRKINYKRVLSSIAPYLANDPHRFFGALIVTAINSEGLDWESVASLVTKGLPKLYSHPSQEVGFLSLTGEEILVPLDGQHRLAALKFAISGRDNEGNAIEDLSPNPDVGKDLITLLIIHHEQDRARKIFNKVNRYARPTSKADNLITSDDDFLAVLARELAEDPFSTRLVNTSSNTIAAKAPYVTTLGTIYSILELIVADRRLPADQLPDNHEQRLVRKLAKEFFNSFCESLAVIKESLKDPSAGGDMARIRVRENSLLMKPFTQVAAAGAAHMLHQLGEASGRTLKVAAAIKKLQQLDWDRTNDEWQGVILNGEKILSGSTARRFVTRYVAYRLGAAFSDESRAELEEDFKNARPRGMSLTLPEPI